MDEEKVIRLLNQYITTQDQDEKDKCFLELMAECKPLTLQVMRRNLFCGDYHTLNDSLWTDLWMKGKLDTWDASKQKKVSGWLRTIARNHLIKETRLPPHQVEQSVDNEEAGSRMEYIPLNCPLEQLMEWFEDMGHSDGDPSYTMEIKELVSQIYCAVELSVFGKQWKQAKNKMDQEMRELARQREKAIDYTEYLQYLDQINAKSLAEHIYDPEQFKFPTFAYAHLLRGHLFAKEPYRELAWKWMFDLRVAISIVNALNEREIPQDIQSKFANHKLELPKPLTVVESGKEWKIGNDCPIFHVLYNNRCLLQCFDLSKCIAAFEDKTTYLDQKQIPKALRDELNKKGTQNGLSDQAKVSVTVTGEKWNIQDHQACYKIEREKLILDFYEELLAIDSCRQLYKDAKKIFASLLKALKLTSYTV